MPSMHIDSDLIARNSLGRVVVIAGGANGIGKALVESFAAHGAHVYFSDWDKQGAKLADTLNSATSSDTKRADSFTSSTSSTGSVTFVQADVRDYAQQLSVFQQAFEQHGTVDNAIYCVGLVDPPGWMCASKLNLESVKNPPKPLDDVLDINLKGCLYFSRIAMTYLKEGYIKVDPFEPNPRKSLTLLSSANGFNEAPGLFAYSASKHGILGILASYRSICVRDFGVRVNVVCPTACDTALVAKARDFILALGAPLSTPDGCGKIVQQLALDSSYHGETVLVMGDRAWALKINETRHQWLDDEAATILEETQMKMGHDIDWADTHA